MCDEGAEIRGGLARPNPTLAPSAFEGVVARDHVVHIADKHRSPHLRRRPRPRPHTLGAGTASQAGDDGHVFCGWGTGAAPPTHPRPGSGARPRAGRPHDAPRARLAHRHGSVRRLGTPIDGCGRARRGLVSAALREILASPGPSPKLSCDVRDVGRTERRLRGEGSGRCRGGAGAPQAAHPGREHRGVSRQPQMRRSAARGAACVPRLVGGAEMDVLGVEKRFHWWSVIRNQSCLPPGAFSALP